MTAVVGTTPDRRMGSRTGCPTAGSVSGWRSTSGSLRPTWSAPTRPPSPRVALNGRATTSPWTASSPWCLGRWVGWSTEVRATRWLPTRSSRRSRSSCPRNRVTTSPSSGRRPSSGERGASSGCEDDGHMSEVTRLLATDDVFREVAELLYGGGGDDLISKMNPTQSDVASHDQKKRKITAGLSAVGAGAGAAGLAVGGHNLQRTYRAARAGREVSHAGTLLPKMKRGAALGHALGKEKLSTALIPLEVAGLGGEVMATRILHGDTKRSKVKKDINEIVTQAGEV